MITPLFEGFAFENAVPFGGDSGFDFLTRAQNNYMTLCIAWVRKRKREESLYMISDSRFTCGDTFDACPKLFPLGRGDCALACAGATEFSYPIVDHIQRSIALNIKCFTRALDFCDLCHTIVDITNRCLMDVLEAYVDQDKGPDFQMIFAGFSVIKGDFDIRVIEYNVSHQ